MPYTCELECSCGYKVRVDGSVFGAYNPPLTQEIVDMAKEAMSQHLAAPCSLTRRKDAADGTDHSIEG